MIIRWIKNWYYQYKQKKINRKFVDSISKNSTIPEVLLQREYISGLGKFSDKLWQARMCCEYKDRMVDRLACNKCKKNTINNTCIKNSYVTCYFSDDIQITNG